MRELARDQARTASLDLDETVKQGGERAVRIDHGDPRDITCLVYSTAPHKAQLDDGHNVQPNRR